MDDVKSPSALSPDRNIQSDSTICELCRNIFTQKETTSLLASKKGIRFKRTRHSMFTSALNGCAMCRELLCMPYHCDSVVPSYRRRDVGVPMAEWPLELWREGVSSWQSLRPFMTPKLRFVIQGDVTKQTYVTASHSKNLTFEVATEYDDCAAKYVHGRAVVRRKCEHTYKRIQEWLEDCDLNHDCRLHQLSGPNTRPTFLVDVSPVQEAPHIVKLYQVGDEDLKYAALSYCWGTNQPFAASTLNIETYLAEIDASTLPRSLRDAIKVTRSLNLWYLWVDSLCILQDNEAAKVHEIARMEHIYSNAYVTISADSARSCSTGFLRAQSLYFRPMALPFRTPSDKLGNVKLTSVHNPGQLPQDTESHDAQPIHTRAWTFQESFMSRRMIVYSKYKIFWVCSKSDGRDGGNQTYLSYTTPTSINSSISPNISDLSLRKLKAPRHSDWCHVAEEYCRRELTDPADKLPALSSIAGYFAEKLNDRYLAGLWRTSLPQRLYWHSAKDGSPVLRRPPKWRSPSWSFMSVDGPISFTSRGHLGDRLYTEESGYKHFCTVLSSATIPVSSEAPYGQVTSGSLYVQCRLLKAHNKTSSHSSGSNVYYFETEEGGQAEIILKFDTFQYNKLGSLSESVTNISISTSQGDLQSTTDLWCLMLFFGIDHWENKNIFGLVLARLPNGSYHRVGTFFALPPANEQFQAQSFQEITII